MATQPQRRTANTPNRTTPKRKKKRSPQGFLYAAITLIFVFMVLATVLICLLVGCNEQSTDESYEESFSESSAAESSAPESKPDNSTPEQSEPEESSKEESVVIPVGSTEAYEKYIGVEYKVDMTDYEQYVCPENEKEFVFVVNHKHPLASDFVPENLVKCTYFRETQPSSWSKINATANKALEAFLKEAAYYGFDDITVTSAYRSYNSQASIYQRYFDNDIKQDYVCDTCAEYFDISYFPEKVTKAERCNNCKGPITETDGIKYCEACNSVADSAKMACCAKCGSAVRRPTEAETEKHVLTYSTKPGTSEHQSGLCCDMHNQANSTSAFDNTPEAKWLAANAHRFGFILRYPPNTQHITGIKHESWHFRYVGRTAATEMYEKGLTLDEYCAETEE
ncbi:MAG: M15 family metallopeptidase [Clostridia bacterium]|nr:M15 family metallopeptidase [Clostridia bacterium]